MSEDHGIATIRNMPSPATAKRHCKAMALADAIFEEDWQYRFFSYDSQWGGDESSELASMRNGSGDHYFILFSDTGVVGKVYSEYCGNSGGKSDTDLPEMIDSFLSEPAFSIQDTSYFFWWNSVIERWECTLGNNSRLPLLAFVAVGRDYYREWAELYFETAICAEALTSIFENLQISRSIVQQLNPERDFNSVEQDVSKILGV